MKKITKVLAIIGAIIVLFVAFIFYTTSGVPRAAEAVMEQLHNGETEIVYQNSLLSQEMGFDDFKQAMGIGGNFDISKAKKLSWTGRGFEDREKYVYGEFEFENGQTQTITFWFIDIDGTLVLSGITGGAPE